MIRYLLALEGRRRIRETTGKDAYRFTAQLTESGISQLIAEDKHALEIARLDELDPHSRG